MVKPKQSRTSGKKQQNERPHVDADWMVVTKQRITILIPPLPNKSHQTMPNVAGESHLEQEINLRKTNSQSRQRTNPHLQCPSEISPSKQQPHQREKSVTSSSPKQAIHPPVTLNLSKPNSISQNLSRSCRVIALDNSPVCSYRERKGIGKCGTFKGENKGMMIFGDGNAFLDRRMRAMYLDKKLKKAGGLENWLVSLGLNGFVKVFQRRNVNKFQMASLTMKKLKDMGTDAVGPRRKLMHAIDCLCEPHCFQHV